MAQLGNDCFAAGQGLMTAADAWAFIDTRIAPVTEVENLPLTQARGRILSADLVASGNVPPHDNAAVDGFAFRSGDIKYGAPTRFKIAGRAAAGHPATATASPGEAIRIFTGAVMPAELDTVAMQEDCTGDDSEVTIPSGLRPGANCRQMGEDITLGGTILRAGQILRPQDIGLAAAAGHARLSVRKRLRAAVFSTGDEIVEPGTRLPVGAIHDANRYTLIALLEGMGCVVRDLGILPDQGAAIAAGLKNAATNADLVVTSGGVSVGDEDHVRGAVEKLGNLHFWRLAIRPGRPLALGQIGNTAFVGIPGNPVAVMVTFLMFVRPLVHRLAGAAATAPQRFPVAAAFECNKKLGRREWVRARLDGTQGDLPAAKRFERDGAGILTSMVESDGLIELAEDITRVSPGDVLPFVLYSELLS
ncbi:MAG: molybdopterin molybdotransferase MoeA [Alphaproteobacteria bacterium]|nr:molybdopterin molybdotransferase MoeA [Alphaproteobacteria bacterium]